jgi:hypothetical protein
MYINFCDESVWVDGRDAGSFGAVAWRPITANGSGYKRTCNYEAVVAIGFAATASVVDDVQSLELRRRLH